MISYRSTRGASPELGFADVLLTGLAPDGGLYVPSRWPTSADIGRAANAADDISYQELAVDVMWPFVEGSIERDAFEQIVHDSYATFEADDVIPLTSLAPNLELVELFHGPTLAFKDVAMQLLGRLFDHELNKRGERVTIVGATSGDTGSAAIEAFRDRDNVDIIILHPSGRTSDVQRRQMTTVAAANVHNLAVEGTFDDCQDLVKAMFADESFRARTKLAAVNSINWARVMAQIVYYLWAQRRAARGDRKLAVVVPTGNFGNVFAGQVARRLGADIDELVVASNSNDILTQFFSSGSMTIGEVSPTLSPSMDIQVSSNLERLIFELLGDDGTAVRGFQASFREQGHIELPEGVLDQLASSWDAVSLDDAQTLQTMRAVYEESGVVLDPHTAVGVGAARARSSSSFHHVVMATAHPSKFPAAVEEATGHKPQLPQRLADLHEREERYETVANDFDAVSGFVSSVTRA